jgi:cyanophycin synthetase
MRAKTGGDVVLFCTRSYSENPHVEAHVARGGIAATLENGQFSISRGRLRIPIATEREVPLMLGGAARFQRQNILAAIAAAYVQGIRYDDIRAGLLSFFPSPTLTPGRLNIIRLKSGARAIVDYAHNGKAIEGLVEFVQQLPARRRVAVITAPGDRRDEDIRLAGRLCAKFDDVIVKEDTDLRGRQSGEIAALLRDGLIEGGLKKNHIQIITSSADAMEAALQMMGDEELLVVIAEKVPQTLAAIQAYAVTAS